MLNLFAVKFECYGDGYTFEKDECVFTVEAIDDCVFNIAIQQPIGKEEWPEISGAIQAALDCASKPIAMSEKAISEIKPIVLTLVQDKDIRLRPHRQEFTLLPLIDKIDKDDSLYLRVTYPRWSLDVFASNYPDLVREVHEDILATWRIYVLSPTGDLSDPARAIRENMLRDWVAIEDYSSRED